MCILIESHKELNTVSAEVNLSIFNKSENGLCFIKVTIVTRNNKNIIL